MKKKCVHCGKDGHLASDCYSLTPAERAKYKEWQSVRKSNDSSVSSNDSSRSGRSNGSAESDSSGSASGSRKVLDEGSRGSRTGTLALN